MCTLLAFWIQADFRPMEDTNIIEIKIVHFFPLIKNSSFAYSGKSVLSVSLSGVQKSQKCIWKIAHRNYSMETNRKVQNIIIQTRESNNYKYSQIQIKLL